MDETLNLKQVAARLGVHYMTAYRYVRQGRLVGERDITGWRVRAADVDRLADAHVEARADADPPTRRTRRVDWASRLCDQLLKGDEAGAWSVIERALAAGADPQNCYLDIVGPALAGIGEGWEDGRLGVADQYVATATAMRIVARLGARFRRPGRSRGTVVLGAPRGEDHSLPIAICADLVRLGRFTVLELGADVPDEAFVAGAQRVNRLVAVGVGVTRVESLEAAVETVATLRAALPGVPVLLGGQAVHSSEVAERAGATGWARDGRDLVGAIEAAVAGIAHLGAFASPSLPAPSVGRPIPAADQPWSASG